ncbi:hypothetical protein GUITHDRAFT_115692 [Guillardia theta CCMP2712]|uniref:Uncharacterized protein n=1 Tax=Guillardia theta (strain CCMP2712) TaxID=905079 RepID=L1IQH8_GUITC|nr:hypothetical protein GUITHDRAFT_115692 [Guillardia theta CCMP2712]EKX38139.1 hypothetical protein GUITHDRAFT_115692 [Guillardia theta CCMP2712]|eukprot:XP_005825119.1 hypothetical protein GUITHDRAFT_115692 [Guillardia theta CCMP2712]
MHALRSLEGHETSKPKLFDVSYPNLDVPASLPLSVGPEFLAGYACGMSRAHKEALSHIDELGSLRCCVTKNEEMISKHTNKISSLEKNLAFASGNYFQSMHLMRDRVTRLEDRNVETAKNLQLALFRVMQLERRSSRHRFNLGKILSMLKKLQSLKRGLGLVLFLAAILALIRVASIVNLGSALTCVQWRKSILSNEVLFAMLSKAGKVFLALMLTRTQSSMEVTFDKVRKMILQ